MICNHSPDGSDWNVAVCGKIQDLCDTVPDGQVVYMRVLSNRYELLQELGQGGMGVVYHARDLELERPVAVKLLPSDLVRNAGLRARFRREAKAAAGLSHPNIAVVHDIGEDSGGGRPTPYLVMEFIKGKTLADVLDEQGPLPADEAAQIVIAILNALEHSHSLGVVHRDIKPSNIMLIGSGPSRQVKVMDFGIAKLLSETATRLTATGAILGTPSYLSPEQARGDETDRRTDIYFLGCVFYELLTGRPPFIGDNVSAVMFQHLQRVPDPPSVYAPEIPPALETVVLRALAKSPGDRYGAAAEMRTAISVSLFHPRAV